MSEIQYGFSACTWGEQNEATLIEPRDNTNQVPQDLHVHATK